MKLAFPEVPEFDKLYRECWTNLILYSLIHAFGSMLTEDRKEILVSTLIAHCVSACPELKLPKLSKYENESLFFFTLYFTNSLEKYVWIHLDNVSMQSIYLNGENFYVPTKKASMHNGAYNALHESREACFSCRIAGLRKKHNY